MKKISFVLFILFSLCFRAFTQEQLANPQPAKPADKLIAIQKGDFIVSIKTNAGVLSNSDLSILAEKVIAKLQEKMKDETTEVNCNLFLSISQAVSKKTGKLQKALEIGVSTRTDFHPIILYAVYCLPKPPFNEEDQTKAIDVVLAGMDLEYEQLK